MNGNRVVAKLRVENQDYSIELYEGVDLPIGIYYGRLLSSVTEATAKGCDVLCWGPGTMLMVKREFANSKVFVLANKPTV